MTYTEFIDATIKKFDWLDMMLIELANIVFGLMLVKAFPSLTAVHFAWLVLAMVLLSLRPMRKVW